MTTLTLDKRGLIQIEINEQTSGKVYDLNGNSVKDAVESGQISESRYASYHQLMIEDENETFRKNIYG